MSSKRFVVPRDGQWAVVAPNSSRASSLHPTQAGAIDAARGYVTNLGGGEVTIQGRNGRFRDSDTVGGGNDPCPPKDSK